MKKINNKGYMLVEVILAFSITFILIYFIMDLVIKSKNKNDDLMVETLVRTDQAIITNKLMNYAMDETDSFDCNSLKNGITDSLVKYGSDTIDIVSKYAKIDVSNVSCSNAAGKVSIKIPMNVEQMKDENFDVIIDYKYNIGDMVLPTCSLSVSGTTINATYSDNEGGSGISYYGFNPSYTGDNSTSLALSVGEHTFYIKDNAGNTNSCVIDVVSTTSKEVCNTVPYQTYGPTMSYTGAGYCRDCYGQRFTCWDKYSGCTGSFDECKSCQCACGQHEECKNVSTCANNLYTKANDTYCYLIK